MLDRNEKGQIALVYTTPEEKKAALKENYRKYRHNNPEKEMWKRAKYRALRKGIEFTIDPDDIEIPEYCPVFGCKLEISDGKAMPNSPSLDRIDSNLGYTPENIWVICYRANWLKNNMTHEEIKMLAEALDNLC
jgi:hypothetical protein